MKVNFIIIHPDNTLSFKKCKTKGNLVNVSRSWKPEFTEGQCVFVAHAKRFFGLWKQTKRFMMAVESAKQCLEIKAGSTKIEGSSWNWQELTDYIAKLVHLSLVKEKPFSNLQIYIIFGLLGFILVLQFLALRGVRFG